jgi:hypothetical protein
MTHPLRPSARASHAAPPPWGQRLDGSGEDVGRSLGRLVVGLLEVVRQVVERQAVRRAEVGDLSDVDIERLGQALMELQATFDQLIETFGVQPDDLFLPVQLEGLLREDGDRERRPRGAGREVAEARTSARRDP